MTYDDMQEEIKYHNMIIKRSKRKLEHLFVLRETHRNKDQITIEELEGT